MSRGYFGIGIDRCKTTANVGSLLRSAQAFDAAWAFTIAARTPYRRQATDTSDASGHLPFIQYPDINALEAGRPRGCQLVVVEVDGDVLLGDFKHPERAVYVLGPEDGDVHPYLRSIAQHTVRMPTAFCLNVATAAAIVMHDRIAKAAR